MPVRLRRAAADRAASGPYSAWLLDFYEPFGEDVVPTTRDLLLDGPQPVDGCVHKLTALECRF